MSGISRVTAEHTLDQARFLEPDAFYWPGFMWLWNGRLTKELLCKQLAEMNENGAKTVWVLPLPKDFRPNSMPTNMEPDYLTEPFMQLFKEVADEAARLSMVLWLSDEPGWPSGGMNGRVIREMPSLARHAIGRQVVKPNRGDTVDVPEHCLSAFVYEGDQIVKRLRPGDRERVNDDGITVELFAPVEIKDRFPDLLKPEAAETFIKLTHEVFKKELGGHFGQTAVAFFNDEAMVANPPWTDDLADDFKKAKGYDLYDHLPALFNKNDDEASKTVRIDFFDWWSSRLAEAYFGTIQNWCRANGVLSIGHLGGEEYTLGSNRNGYGHILRILRKFDIPGVDTIWRQLFPADDRAVEVEINQRLHKYPGIETTGNHHFPKYASSAAHQNGTPWALTESFAIYGSGLTLEQMRWLTNYQYVRGLNMMTMSCSYSSSEGHHMAGARPNFTPDNPQWNYMSNYHSYTARISYALNLGRPAVYTAVYFPVKDIWAGGPAEGLVAKANDELVKQLLDNQCDFDFIDDDVLEDESTKAMDGELHVGPMSYNTVYISKSQWMSERAKSKLAQFISTGGMVVYVDRDDDGPALEGSISCRLSELNRHVRPLVGICEEKRRMIKVCKRSLEDGSLYFISNEHATNWQGEITFDEQLPAYMLDPERGSCWRLSRTSYSAGKCTISISLDYADAVLVFFSQAAMEVTEEPAQVGDPIMMLQQGWACRILEQYSIGEHQVEIDRTKSDDVFSVELGDWRDQLGDHFTGYAAYEVKFECSKEAAEQSAFLDLGTVKYNSDVYLNGVHLGKRTWSPYRYDTAGILKEGVNELTVIVTNTMANQYVTTNALDKYPSNTVPAYHYIEKAFERQSLESGLFGPVMLRASRK